jgi:2,4-dienoyl-CoA reductase-like NADH-dependent reductase (Old Yellow Enzyme family)
LLNGNSPPFSYQGDHMASLFSPLVVASMELPNRLVMAPTPSGLAETAGFVTADIVTYYHERASTGLALIVSEPFQVVAPPVEHPHAHLGLYHDAFVPPLHSLVQAVHANHGRLLISLTAPADALNADPYALAWVGEQFLLAAWRAVAAGADGVMLSAVDNGLLHQLLSPLHNLREDHYGGAIHDRLRLAQEIVEGVRTWLGRRRLVGFRLPAEELTPGGLSLHDARVVARRLVAAGVQLLDVEVINDPEAAVATFPGWSVPLVNSIKRIVPEVPVICAEPLDDPYLADSIISDGSVDFVTLDDVLEEDPRWPRYAARVLSL